MEWTPPRIISYSHRTHTHATPDDPARQDQGSPTSPVCIRATESRDAATIQDLRGNLPALGGLSCFLVTAPGPSTIRQVLSPPSLRLFYGLHVHQNPTTIHSLVSYRRSWLYLLRFLGSDIWLAGRWRPGPTPYFSLISYTVDLSIQRTSHTSP